MNGVTFGRYHSYKDFGLVRTSKKIGKAEVKKNTVEVEGSSIELDYTEAFGEPKFKPRPLEFEFQMLTEPKEFLNLFSEIQNAIQGFKIRITLDEDPDYYYLGRVTLSFKNEKNKGIITVSGTCEPWKYKHVTTIVTKDISGTGTVILKNSRKRVVPEITTTASMSVKFGDYTSKVGAGTFIIPTFELSPGDNEFQITGTGNITFKYTEGSL